MATLTCSGLHWRVHVAKVLAEVMTNPSCSVLKQPLLILDDLLRKVAARAVALDDPELHKLMVQLTLYSVADPDSQDHDAAFVSEFLA